MNTTTTDLASNGSKKLTIAQALRRIKKVKGLFAEATQRAMSVTSWIAGKKPTTFDFAKERAQRAALQNEMVRFESAVAKANATTSIEVGGVTMTLARAIRELQEVKGDLAWLPTLNLRAGEEVTTEQEWDALQRGHVYRKVTVQHEAVMTEPERIVLIQQLRDRFEAINDALETANHKTVIEVDPPAPAAQDPSTATA